MVVKTGRESVSGLYDSRVPAAQWIVPCCSKCPQPEVGQKRWTGKWLWQSSYHAAEFNQSLPRVLVARFVVISGQVMTR